MNTTTDINDLDINVDITVSGPEDYTDATTTAPLPIGSYELRLLDWAFEPAKVKGKPPVVVLRQVEVASGPQEGKRISFQRVYATPFDRKNPITGETTRVSQLADMIRAFDRSFDTSNMTIETIQRFLNDKVEERATFKAKIDWEGFDTDYFNSEAAKRGIAKGDYTSPGAKELNKQARLIGKRAFPDGKPVATNPHSGNKVEARMRITNYFPARD